MSDVTRESVWNQRVSEFKDFARGVDAKFELKILGRNKECVSVTQYFNRESEDKNVKSS
jgi:hypothetical protein